MRVHYDHLTKYAGLKEGDQDQKEDTEAAAILGRPL
jgi:hypothetical protein